MQLSRLDGGVQNLLLCAAVSRQAMQRLFLRVSLLMKISMELVSALN